MAEPTDSIIGLHERPVAADFIENHLHEYHPMFKNLPARYDRETQQFVSPPDGSRVVIDHPESAPRRVSGRPESEIGHVDEPSSSTNNAMKCWDKVFPEAMVRFNGMSSVKRPKHRKPEYDIRSDTTWAEVYGKLETAYDNFTDKTGYKGKLRKVWYWISENAPGPMKVGIALVPQTDIVTPVLGIVEIVLDAVEKGAEVRKTTVEAFDELDSIFSDVEAFLGTFPGHKEIEEKATDVVMNVLLAAERMIGFFTESTPKRGTKAFLLGESYKKDLTDSISTILSSSKKLMAEAVKTSISNVEKYSRATQRIHQLIMNGQEDLAVKVNLTYSKIDEVAEQNKTILKTTNDILSMCMDKNKQERDELIRKHKGKDWENAQLKVILRAVTPSQSMSGTNFPQARLLHISQEQLWNSLHIRDVDTDDMELIEERRAHLPRGDRIRAEQIVHSQVFQDWIISPTSTRLLVHGNFSGPLMQISALSLFCVTLTKRFRARDRYVCLVWFCGCHLDADGADSDTSFSDSDDDDSGYPELDDEEEDVPYSRQTRTEPVERMLRSLIAQLLCDYDFGSSTLLPPEADMSLIEEGNLEELRYLFDWLVRQLPEEITLFCILDGIVFYEREEFEDPMLDALGDILSLTAESSIRAAVKVLVTSPWPTSTVRVAFENDDDDDSGVGEEGQTTSSIISLDTLPRSQWDPSDERVERELGVLDDEDSQDEG